MHNKQKKLSDAIKDVIAIRGIGVFENSSIFCAMIDDIVPYLDKERKILHRVLNNDVLKMLSDAYQTSSNHRKIVFSKVEIELKENMGLSDEWCKIILDNFQEAFEMAVIYDSTNITEMRGYFEKVKQRFAVGKFAIMALKTDGTVKLIELGKKLDYDLSTWKGERISTVVGSIHDFVALTEKGTVLAIGENRSGQCDVTEWNNIVKVTASIYNIVGLKRDGTVIISGSNSDGQRDVSSWNNIIDIKAEKRNVLGLKADGTVVISGSNTYERGRVSEWNNIVKIAIDRNNCYGIQRDGTVVASGSNKYGQCDVVDWNKIVDIIVGVTRVFGITEEGKVVGAGKINEKYIYQILAWEGVVTIVQGTGYIAALRCDGKVLVSLDENNMEKYQHLKKIKVDSWKNVVALFSTGTGLIGICSDGMVMHTGFDYGESKRLKELCLFRDVKQIDEECKAKKLVFETKEEKIEVEKTIRLSKADSTEIKEVIDAKKIKNNNDIKYNKSRKWKSTLIAIVVILIIIVGWNMKTVFAVYDEVENNSVSKFTRSYQEDIQGSILKEKLFELSTQILLWNDLRVYNKTESDEKIIFDKLEKYNQIENKNIVEISDKKRIELNELIESKEAYHQAELAFEEEDYALAIKKYNLVIKNDNNHRKVKSATMKATNRYENFIVQKLKELAKVNDVENAVSIFNEAYDILPQNKMFSQIKECMDKGGTPFTYFVALNLYNNISQWEKYQYEDKNLKCENIWLQKVSSNEYRMQVGYERVWISIILGRYQPTRYFLINLDGVKAVTSEEGEEWKIENSISKVSKVWEVKNTNKKRQLLDLVIECE